MKDTYLEWKWAGRPTLGANYSSEVLVQVGYNGDETLRGMIVTEGEPDQVMVNATIGIS